MKSGFIRKEADLICLFGSLQEKRAKTRAHRMDSGQMKGLSEGAGRSLVHPDQGILLIGRIVSLFKAVAKSL